MAQVKLQEAYRVDIIESERGWGSKVDETKYFSNELEAKAFVQKYNDQFNIAKAVPDWYMVAQYVGLVR